MADCVKVAVRVRPFTRYELESNSKCCVSMKAKDTTIINPETSQVHSFTFDFSYWSHVDSDAHFSSQDVVFNDLGAQMLENAWQGFNTSLLAYGQTGAGKSFSMLGVNEAMGLIPRICRSLFEKIEAKKADPFTTTTYHVEASMLEIYNEQVRDLFNPSSLAAKNGLRIREHPITGPYVEGLEKCVVHSHQELFNLLEEGAKVRTIAKTNMNDESSRAHTIFQIYFSQKKTVQGKGNKVITTERVSTINLVDLAGSERVSKTGATGERLREGSIINKSLTSLGIVITRLAEQASGKKAFIPYRDSCLTWLLKESLGGNSKTIMLAAISPADANFSETLSTLRYANNAKNIKNVAKVNEDATSKLINDLKDEIDKLKKALASDPEKASLKEKLDEAQRIIQNMSLSSEEKDLRSQQLKKQRQSFFESAGLSTEMNELDYDPKTTPRLINLNQDEVMSGKLIFWIKDGITKFGSNPDVNNVIIYGKDVEEEHAQLIYDDHVAILSICSNALIYVNGKRVEHDTVLNSGDRIIMGEYHVYTFLNPCEESTQKKMFDWYDAQQELANEQRKEFETKIQSLESTIESHNRDSFFQQELVAIIPKISLMNGMADTMGRKVKYSMKIVIRNNKPQITIQVRDNSTSTYWTPSQFHARLVQAEKLHKQFVQNPQQEAVATEQDPFGITMRLAGTATCLVLPNSNQDFKLPLVSESNQCIGKLNMHVVQHNSEHIVQVKHVDDCNLCNCSIQWKLAPMDVSFVKSKIMQTPLFNIEKRYKNIADAITFTASLFAEQMLPEENGDFLQAAAPIVSPPKQVQVKLHPMFQHKYMDVLIIEAFKLPKAGLFAKGNPYCSIKLGDLKRKTKIKNGTKKPYWNEVHRFSLVHFGLQDIVTIKVVQHNQVLKNNMVGTIMFTLQDAYEIFIKNETKWMHLNGKSKKAKLCFAIKFT